MPNGDRRLNRIDASFDASESLHPEATIVHSSTTELFLPNGRMEGSLRTVNLFLSGLILLPCTRTEIPTEVSFFPELCTVYMKRFCSPECKEEF